MPMLRKLIVYLKGKLAMRDLKMISPLELVYELQDQYFID